MKYVAVLGSRNYSNIPKIQKVIDKLPSDVVIVSGGASGADIEAENYARHLKHLWVMILTADWTTHGKRAGILRTQRLLLFIKEHHGRVICFWDGTSKGTAYTIGEAKRMMIPLTIYGPNGKRIP